MVLGGNEFVTACGTETGRNAGWMSVEMYSARTISARKFRSAGDEVACWFSGHRVV